jgi:uncharacterized protein (TIGR03437 family)
MALAGIACCALSATGQTALAVQQTRYELRAGEAIPIVAPQATIYFLAHSKTRHVVVTNVSSVGGDSSTPSGGLVAAPNRAGDQILLGASLRMKPGEYTVTLSATSAAGATGAAGTESQTTLTVLVKPRVTVPNGSTRPPVVLLNGWEEGFTGTCPVATSSSDDFGNLASYLVSDGVPVVYLFDNCLEDAGQMVETLGNDLATFLNSITYDNGEQVPQIDLVGFSLGGLIARAYLAGLQPDESLLPPTTTLVRDLVLIATPNFGSFVAGNYAVELTGTQSAELVPASGFLWNLATWNQRSDDLRGVNAIAIIGNAGLYTPSLSATTSLTNASDGLVSLTSASLGFVDQAVDTRVVPFCHVDPSTFTNTLFGSFECNAPGIANVNSTSQDTGVIVRSFLAGNTNWQSVGTTPATDPYLSIDGAMYFALVNSTDGYVADISSVTFGTVPLVNGGDTNTIYYADFVAGTGALTVQSASIGTVNCGTLAEPLEFTSGLRCKLGLLIIDVGPLTGNGGKTVNAGSAITISGSGFGSQCTGCKVIATLAGSATGQQLTTTAWSNTSITANLPSSFTGLVTIEVTAVNGIDSIAVMANAQATLAVSAATLQFAYTTPGALPAAQSFQITNSGSGTLAWTATANATWITLSASSGTAPSTLSVSISPAALSAGTYTGSIQITATGASNTPASVGVTLVVTQAPPSLVLGSQALTFQFTNGGAVPTAQNVTISNAGGGTLAWAASTNVYWLGVSTASGTAPSTLTVSVNPVNLAAGSYPGIVTVTAAGAIGSPAQISITLVVTGTQPGPTIAGLGSAATFLPPIASATWVAIVGTNLSQTTYTWQGTDFVNGQVPTSLEGVSVSINGIAAYVEYISSTQINVLAPDDATVGPVQVQVTVAGQTSNSLSTPKAQFAPAFFTFGDGYVAAQHLSYVPVGAPNLLPGVVTTPAQPGETIVLYGTGFGPTNPPLPTAQLVITPEPLANSVQITIGGVMAPVTFNGLVGPGLYQFNVTVPNLPSGDAAVLAKIGGAATQTGVSVTVQ